MFKFIKRINSEDIHRNYPVESFQINKHKLKEVNKKVSQYRDDFAITLRNENIAGDMGEIYRVLPLIEELKFYYNNDFCLSIAHAVALVDDGSIDRRIKNYYLENAILRIASIWEYFFIIVSEILNTELIVGKDVREQLIESTHYNIDFVPSGNGFKVVTRLIEEEHGKEIEKEIKKKYRLFNISIKNSSNELLKTVRSKYSSKENIQRLFDVYKSLEVAKVIGLRNEIVHRRPLIAKFSISPNGIFPGNAVSIDPNGWFDISGMHNIMEKNVSAIKEAIGSLIEIIFYNELPSLKQNENFSFFAYEVKCNDCTKDILINAISTNFFIKEKINIICPSCESVNTKINKTREVRDVYFFQNFNNYSNFLNKYWSR